jgi:hypothetical protein
VVNTFLHFSEMADGMDTLLQRELGTGRTFFAESMPSTLKLMGGVPQQPPSHGVPRSSQEFGMSREKMHVVVEIGGEGGSLKLFASASPAAPNYVLAITDQSLLLIGEGEVIEGERGRAASWRGALKLLDRYPWSELYPLHVHPDYLKRVLDAVKRRLARNDPAYIRYRLQKWREATQAEAE